MLPPSAHLASQLASRSPLRSRCSTSSRSPDPNLPDQCAKQQQQFLPARHHGPAAQYVETLRLDSVENRLAALAKEIQRDAQFLVHHRADLGTLGQHGSPPRTPAPALSA